MATTDYEQQRDARIRSNNAVLEKLGINRLVPAGLRAAKGKTTHRKRARATVPEEGVERRRSSRLKNLPAERDGAEVDALSDEDDLGDNRRGARRRQSTESKARRPAVHPAPEDGEAVVPSGDGPPEDDLPAASAGSTMGLNADVAGMQGSWLGRKVVPQNGSGSMKAWALKTLHGNTRAGLKFNKYSGIIQFANAVALFVNVRGKTGSYPNLFLDGGRKMTWFGAKGMDAEHPVIKRILACSGDALDRKLHVVLFCREEGCSYVYCGRVAVDCFYPKTAPVKVVFNLCNYDTLAKSQDVAELDLFTQT